MQPIVAKTPLLLVVLMFVSVSAAWTPKEMCRDKYPAIPCRNQRYGKGWYQMGNRCVRAFYHTTHLNFVNAENTCRFRWNGNLVSIHSLVELCQVECAMYRTITGKAHYWIGLYMTPGRVFHYTWTDGTGTSDGFTHWAWRQPDYLWWREECIEMNYWSWGLWNDENCGHKRPYVCAVKV